MTELERIARQYVQENKLTLGEQLALSVFVAKANEMLAKSATVGPRLVVDNERGWKIEEGK